MEEMTQTLEDLLLCESLPCEHRDLIERCLEEGYAALSEDDKSTIRRLLNRRAASLGSTALQRWRERRRQRESRAAPAGKSAGSRKGKGSGEPLRR